MALTTNLSLPLLEAAQAQKEVTVNEALSLIDRHFARHPVSGTYADWRVNPIAVTDSGGQAASILAAMQGGEPAPDLTVSPATTRTLTFDLPALLRDGMVAFDLDADTDNVYTINYEESFDGGASYSAPVAVTLYQPNSLTGYRLQKHSIAAGLARRVRLTFAHNRTAGSSDVGFRIIRELGFYQFAPNRQHDYIVCLAASIMEHCIRQRDWRRWWKDWYGRDPVVFNEGVQAENSTQILARVSALLARHPQARYVLIHAGGNDVSANRPYAADDQSKIDLLRSNLEAMAQAIRSAGRIPLFSRLSYRNYTASPAVNGQTNPENGSLPYNQAVYDRVIARYSPQAHDGEKGLIDPYTYLFNNTHLIDLVQDTTGVHPYGYGGYRLSQYWALATGHVLFLGRGGTLAAESATTGVPGAKEDVIISFGDTGAKGIWHPIETGLMDSPEGMTYNRISGNAIASLTPLLNTQGERCPLGLSITTAFSTLNTTGFVNATDTVFLRRSKIGNAVINSGASAVLEITGLNNSATYALTFLGSRDAIASRLTRVTIGGTGKTFDAANNDSNVASFTGIAPASGKITVTIQADPATSATFGYLAVMRVSRE